ncbi:kinase-like domain-containing protein [Stachybotrys elegans]|uniref:non-specific serine/threonine protein kinase n=1 Tax=Stachybotrys elegans TaxID=80388 RepID=A0A8K0SJX4_9HYPO|nr:kinase-like domain-containing protein [Stachybotrys elegans]
MSSDEGEIVENGTGHGFKASPLPYAEGSGVDRRDRHRNRNSPEYDGRHSAASRRSRSPRGFKRARDDYGRDRDPRSRYSENHYERSRVTYEDLDRPPSRGSELSYDGRSRDLDRDYDRRRDRSRDGRYRDSDRYSDKRPRNRSRSPKHPRRPDRGRGDRFNPDRRDNFTRDARYNDRSVSFQATDRQAARNTVIVPEPSKVEVDENWTEPEQVDEEAEIERRRKRREEILAKSSSATPLLLHAVGATEKMRAASPASPQTPHASNGFGTPRSDAASASPSSQREPSPGGINLLDDKSLMNKHGEVKADNDDGPSAADYDPTNDMKEDERRDELRHGQVVLHGEPHAVEPKVQKSIEENEDKDDDDDDFDMFADDFDEEKFATKPAKTAVPVEADELADNTGKGGILEGDDKDGYYKIRIGEILNGRYQVQAPLGRGMFSGVARAMDITTKSLVAIKIMRNNDALRKGGFTEIAILQKLNEADPDKKRHIVRFERHFDHKGHLCMAFENLSMNLREVLRKFGNNIGINLLATRTYAYQIFVALAHMRKCSIIHADLKPDNILVNEQRNVLKICDLGTAIDRSDAATAHTEITPYLVSRFYRAPEIILGMPYDYGVDMWSIGCTLYELYTGKILFTGDSNNQMLKAIMETRGKITPKMYRRGQLSAVHFDENGQFVSYERDKILNKTAVRTLNMVKPTRDLRTRLMAVASSMGDAEARELNHFIDLLEHCLALNPDKRIKPADALKHPFFTAKSNTTRR